MKTLLFVLVCTAIAQVAGEVSLPDMRNAECFTYQGRTVCDFEYNLRKLGPRYETFSGNGVPAGFGSYGGSTGSGGSLCLHSQPGTSQSYSFCGGSAAGSGWEDPSGWQWQATRYAVTAMGYLPGQYSAMRGQLEAARLNQSEAAYREYESRLVTVSKDLELGNQKFSESTLAPAVGRVVEESLALVHDSLKSALLIPLEKLPKSEPPSTTVEVNELSADPDVSVPLQSHLDRSEVGDPLQKWKDLEPLWQVALDASLPLPPKDRAAILSAYRKSFDSNGLLNSKTLGKESGRIAENLSQVLRTRVDTVEGIAVRYQLNRGLVAHASSNEEGIKSLAGGGIALGVGADQAFADGKPEEGARLLELAVTGVDLALGFVPVVGAINDLAQIVTGMATGHDYAGHEMSTADFALRGAGVMLGLVGAGAAGKAVLRIGAQTLDRSFVLGAQVLRRLRMGRKLVDAARGETAVAIELAGQVGRHPKLLQGEIITEKIISEEVLKTVDAGSGAVQARHLEELSLLERQIVEGGAVQRFGPLTPGVLSTKMADTFRSSSYLSHTTSEPLKLYRVFGGEAKEYGAYWSRLKPTGPLQASIDFALEPAFKNSAARWIEITVPAGTKLFDGFAASILKEGQTILGGAPQTIIIDEIIKARKTGGGIF